MRLISILALAALAGCSQPAAMVDLNQPNNARATSVSAPPAAGGDRCKTANWQSTGYRHGVSGYPLAALEQITKACAGSGVKVDRLAYSTGRLKGLATFCTMDNGYRRAKAGHPAENPCPPSLAPAYAKGYAAGKLQYGSSKIR